MTTLELTEKEAYTVKVAMQDLLDDKNMHLTDKERSDATRVVTKLTSALNIPA